MDGKSIQKNSKTKIHILGKEEKRKGRLKGRDKDSEKQQKRKRPQR